MFAGDAGECIANDAVQKGDELSVAAGYPIEETVPVCDRTECIRCDTGDLSHIIPWVMWAALAAAQIEHATGRIKQPWVDVPLISGGSEAPVGSGKAFNRGNGFGARNGVGEFLVAFASGAATCLAGVVKSLQRIVELPIVTIPDKPFCPRRDISEFVGVAFCEAQRQCLVAVGGRTLLP